MYIIAYKNLKPDEVESNTLIVEGKIEFNATLGKNYAWIGQKFDHFNQ